jgi:hypothetical protein
MTLWPLLADGEWPPLSHLAGTSNLFIDDARCVGEFRTTFRTIPAFVAQWIEQRFPKPQVAGSIPAEGAKVNALPLLPVGVSEGP